MHRVLLLSLITFSVAAVDLSSGNTDLETCPGDKGFGNGTQNCGYVKVREGAHMFWWLYKAPSKWDELPLIVWLAGGPGASACGHGNFMSVGPLDENKKERPNSWVNDFNILFVDSPVGAGFSYVDHLKYLANDNIQVAQDMVNMTKDFVSKHTQFKTSPFYVYGDGYGGKFAVDYVRLLQEEIDKNEISVNLVGIGLGNVWASPVDNVLSYAPFLYEVSLVDEIGRDIIQDQAEFTKSRFDDKEYYHATLEWIRTLDWVYELTDGIDFGNILTKMPNDTRVEQKTYYQTVLDRLSYGRYMNNNSEEFSKFMNGEVKEALKVPSNVTWGKQSGNTFENLFIDFMKPVTASIEKILNTTKIAVHIANGNLDVMVDTPGQFHWINNLIWPEVEEFHNATRKTVWADGLLEGYQKTGGKLSFYWMNVAGVDFINDNTKATRAFLRAMTRY